MQQQLLPNIPGMGMMPFPYMPTMVPTPMNPGMPGNNITPQQQQVMWQQMQNMQNMVSVHLYDGIMQKQKVFTYGDSLFAS